MMMIGASVAALLGPALPYTRVAAIPSTRGILWPDTPAWSITLSATGDKPIKPIKPQAAARLDPAMTQADTRLAPAVTQAASLLAPAVASRHRLNVSEQIASQATANNTKHLLAEAEAEADAPEAEADAPAEAVVHAEAEAEAQTKVERTGQLTPRNVLPRSRPKTLPSLRQRLKILPTFTPQQAAVASILAATSFNLLGFTMSLPINLALRSHFELVMGGTFGSLTSAYPLGVLGALFLWPRLSDKIGRKPIIALSFAGSGLGLALQSWALHRHWSLRCFLACRVLTGLCAGSGPVAKAYLADLGASDGHLPRYMAWRDAANTAAFIAGPFLGGWLYRTTSSVSAVVGATALGSFLASLLVTLLVGEPGKMPSSAASSADSVAPKPSPPKPASGSKAKLQGRQLAAAIATVCIMSALYNCGTSTFAAFFGPLAQLQSGLDVQGVGTAITALHGLSFIVSTTCAARLQRAIGTVGAAIVGLSLIGSGLVGMGASASLAAGGSAAAFWSAAVTYQVGVPLFGPTIPTLIMQSAPANRRGALMGLDESCNVLARIGAPIAFGVAFRRWGALACLGCAGAATYAAMLVAAARQAIISSQSSETQPLPPNAAGKSPRAAA